jgi:hypothetical protein
VSDWSLPPMMMKPHASLPARSMAICMISFGIFERFVYPWPNRKGKNTSCDTLLSGKRSFQDFTDSDVAEFTNSKQRTDLKPFKKRRLGFDS